MYLPSPSDPNLIVYPKETPTIHKCTKTRLFITALFITAKYQKLPKYRSTGDRLDNLCCAEQQVTTRRKNINVN